MAARQATIEALESLYRAELPRFVRTATAITGDEAAGRDAVQDAFVQAVRKRDRYKSDAPLEAWVWRTVINAALALRRGPASAFERVSATAESTNGVPEHDADVRAWVASLPERQRLVVFLRYFADLDYRSIATALDVEVGTVSTTLAAARCASTRPRGGSEMTDLELEVADSFERIFPVPTVIADWDDVRARAEARRRDGGTRLPSRRVVAIAAMVVLAGLLVAPAVAVGDHILELIHGKSTRGDVQTPAWSPDGRKLAFVSQRDGNSEIYVMNADGSEEFRVLHRRRIDGQAEEQRQLLRRSRTSIGSPPQTRRRSRSSAETASKRAVRHRRHA